MVLVLPVSRRIELYFSSCPVGSFLSLGFSLSLSPYYNFLLTTCFTVLVLTRTVPKPLEQY